MKIGLVGLGRMGGNMAIRLLRNGHEVVGYARKWAGVQELLDDGSISAGAKSLENLVSQLEEPRIVWLMVPAASVDETLESLVPLLSQGDIVVDGGNSHYVHDIARAKALKPLGLHYLDAGVSGGIHGLTNGYCIMVGGNTEAVQHLDPIFSALAPGAGNIPRTPGLEEGTTAERGYLHCGPVGAGHFVKMVHNGVEYGMMAAIGEGLNILHNADLGMRPPSVGAEIAPLENPENFMYQFDLAAITELWRRGSVIKSWLLDLIAQALREDSELTEFSDQVKDSGEGRWTIIAATEEGVPTPVLSAALNARFSTQAIASFCGKVLQAMRSLFGGHKKM